MKKTSINWSFVIYGGIAAIILLGFAKIVNIIGGLFRSEEDRQRNREHKAAADEEVANNPNIRYSKLELQGAADTIHSAFLYIFGTDEETIVRTLSKYNADEHNVIADYFGLRFETDHLADRNYWSWMQYELNDDEDDILLFQQIRAHADGEISGSELLSYFENEY